MNASIISMWVHLVFVDRISGCEVISEEKK